MFLYSILVFKKKNGKTRRKLWSREWLQTRSRDKVLNMLQHKIVTEDPTSYTNFTRMIDEQLFSIEKKIQIKFLNNTIQI